MALGGASRMGSADSIQIGLLTFPSGSRIFCAPWPQFFEKAQKELTCDLKMIDDFFTNEKDSKLFSLIKPYIEKNISIIEKSQKIIEAHTKKDLSPILSTLKLFTA